jgi:LAS superfamily LD-carboxypeptidase LdcB
VDAIALAAAAGVAPADPDTPGPVTGPPCPADHAYVDEAPTGMRSDVILAWKAVVRAGKAKKIIVCLNDGKRSRAQQQAQYDAYVKQYGKAVANQLVLPPNKSAHVIGIAVDVQPAKAYQWLQSTKGALGFCRIYDNEAWHFEFNPAYRVDGCPARLPKPER